jgi:HEAT repeat protein
VRTFVALLTAATALLAPAGRSSAQEAGDPPGAPGTRRPDAGGRGRQDGIFWWEHEKALLRDMHETMRERWRKTLWGEGVHGRTPPGPILPASDAVVRTLALPPLREVLAAERGTESADVQSAAALALGRCGDAAAIPRLVAIASGAGGPFDATVAQSSVLALGLLGRDTPEVREFLLSLVALPRGVGLSRPFAAVSLGLLCRDRDADGSVARRLFDAADKTNDAEMKGACLLGIGLLEDPRNAPALLALARTDDEPAAERQLEDRHVSHAIAALGRLGRAGTGRPGEDTAVLDFLVRLLTRRRGRDDASMNTLRSAAIALGRIGARTPDADLQRRALDALRSVASSTEDRQQRHFALAAIGALGAGPQTEFGVRAACVESLRRALSQRHAQAAQYAASGLALIGRSYRARGVQPDDALLAGPIRNAFRDARSFEDRAGFAVASGLLCDRLAIPALRAALEDPSAPADLRGSCALALGMIGPESGALAAVRRALTVEDGRKLKIRCATAAALLADGRVVPDLLALLADGNQSQYVLGSAASALGVLGDERAIHPLAQIARDRTGRPDVMRALAVVALGLIADRSEGAFPARISEDVNSRDQFAFERALLTLL